MAIEAGVFVVPVSIAGAHKLMGKGQKIVRPGEAVVRFDPAVNGASYTMDQRNELTSRVERIVAAGLPPDQQPI